MASPSRFRFGLQRTWEMEGEHSAGSDHANQWEVIRCSRCISEVMAL